LNVDDQLGFLEPSRKALDLPLLLDDRAVALIGLSRCQ
jgi:hypothetical protein